MLRNLEGSNIQRSIKHSQQSKMDFKLNHSKAENKNKTTAIDPQKFIFQRKARTKTLNTSKNQICSARQMIVNRSKQETD